MIASEKPLHIDIPVKLADVKMLFSIGALQFEGDLPASVFHMQLIEDDIANWDAKSEVVAVFHTNAGHVTLHDSAYNADRGIATGNPYKDLVANLTKRGVKVELCGATGESSQLGECGSASRYQGQHRRHGENGAACSTGLCENHRMNCSGDCCEGQSTRT